MKKFIKLYLSLFLLVLLSFHFACSNQELACNDEACGGGNGGGEGKGGCGSLGAFAPLDFEYIEHKVEKDQAILKLRPLTADAISTYSFTVIALEENGTTSLLYPTTEEIIDTVGQRVFLIQHPLLDSYQKVMFRITHKTSGQIWEKELEKGRDF
jgi:hypothetical protein